MLGPLCITELPQAMPVCQVDEGQLGVIEALAVDKSTGQTQYALVKSDNAEDRAFDLHLLPWNALRFDAQSNSYLSTINRRQLNGAPCLGEKTLNDRLLSRRLCRHYGLSLSGHASC